MRISDEIRVTGRSSVSGPREWTCWAEQSTECVAVDFVERRWDLLFSSKDDCNRLPLVFRFIDSFSLNSQKIDTLA